MNPGTSRLWNVLRDASCMRSNRFFATTDSRGLRYPISLRLIHADMPAAAMLRFFFSLLLCGLVAAAYPFFVVTFFSLRSLYPVFVVSDYEGASSDADLLRKVGRWNAVYLVVAASAPFLAITALIADSWINDNVLPDGAERSMAVFSAIGVLGLPWLFWLSHAIRTDLATLSGVLASDERGS